MITLYDSMRVQGPLMREGENSWTGMDWAQTDKAIGENLSKIAASGKKVVLVTNTVISPSAKAAIAAFKAKLGGAPAPAADGTTVAPASSNVEHIQYDTISYSGVTNANAKSFGQRVSSR
ncbi:MAG: hypothetical protein IPH53_07755 [Flavobacteriales bacterium]|nr:hypothetical protein [Flavobacteriales bacterium]